jgi:hypothetical protein
MHDKLIPLLLQQAAEAEGSTQALASRLNAPEATLLRWMSGRAQTPLRAFLAVLEYLMQLERKAANSAADAAAPAADGTQPDRLQFPLGPLLGRCARCDGTEFRLVNAGTLRLTSPLACTACGASVIHGNLLAQLAKDAVHQSRAVAARTRRATEHARAVVARGRRHLEESARRVNPANDPD